MTEAKVKRMQLRLTQDDAKLIDHWSKALNLSKTDFMLAAVKHYIHFQEGNYDLKSAEVRRLNQLIDTSHLQTQAIQTMNQSMNELLKQFYLLTTGSIPAFLSESEDMLIKRIMQVESEKSSDKPNEIQRLNRIKFRKKR